MRPKALFPKGLLLKPNSFETNRKQQSWGEQRAKQSKAGWPRPPDPPQQLPGGFYSTPGQAETPRDRRSP